MTFVVPRYGVEVIGGAEFGVRMLAEQLVVAGVDVEVSTTCALDAATWENSYRAGSAHVNGVLVRRFPTLAPRHRHADDLLLKLVRDPEAVPAHVERRWLERQGPLCPATLVAAGSSGADALVFSPYLFWPTVEGVLRFGSRAVLQPATHQEGPIHLPIFRRVFAAAGALAFYSPEEQRLTERLFPAVSARPQSVIGLGVLEAPGSPAAARAAAGVGERPYLLCLGRVDAGKGTVLLHDFFATYKQRHPGPLALVFAGPVVTEMAPHPDIVVARAVDEAVKWGLLRGAEVLVSPSPLESFSLALLEGWRATRPALVNAACQVTAGHVTASGAGLSFDSYGAFEVSLERLLADDTLRARMGAAGREYVEQRYSWPRLAQRYRAFLEAVVVRNTRAGPGLD